MISFLNSRRGTYVPVLVLKGFYYDLLEPRILQDLGFCAENKSFIRYK
jgi:hypothetical protein